MYEAIQVILIVIGAIFIIKGLRNFAKGSNIYKLLSMFIYEKPKYSKEKRK